MRLKKSTIFVDLYYVEELKEWHVEREFPTYSLNLQKTEGQLLIAVGKGECPTCPYFNFLAGASPFKRGVDEKHQENEMSSREQNVISLDEELQWERILSPRRENGRFGHRKTKIAPIGQL